MSYGHPFVVSIRTLLKVGEDEAFGGFFLSFTFGSGCGDTSRERGNTVYFKPVS